MTENKKKKEEINFLFHASLLAYQDVVGDILGSGAKVFIHPLIETLSKILEKEKIDLIEGETIEEALANVCNKLENSGIVKEARFEKLGRSKYALSFNGCIFHSSQIHKILEPMHAICPLALIVMTMFQKMTGKRVKVTETKFTATGNKTVIESL
jgi:hypothetical protein